MRWDRPNLAGPHERGMLHTNLLPMPIRRGRDRSGAPKELPRRAISLVGSHVPEFASERLNRSGGGSLAASDIWNAYEARCASRNLVLLSRQRLGIELYGTWSREAEVLRSDPLSECATRGMSI